MALPGHRCSSCPRSSRLDVLDAAVAKPTSHDVRSKFRSRVRVWVVVLFSSHFHPFAGGHRGAVTPVPIPNTEVKRPIAEGSAGLARARVGRRRLSFCPFRGGSGLKSAAGGVRHPYRGVAQPGSASALGAECRRFKSSRPDHHHLRFKEAKKPTCEQEQILIYYYPFSRCEDNSVGRVPPCQGGCRGFESRSSLQKTKVNGGVAQLVEQVTLNHWVQGSNPCAPTISKVRLGSSVGRATD